MDLYISCKHEKDLSWHKMAGTAAMRNHREHQPTATRSRVLIYKTQMNHAQGFNYAPIRILLISWQSEAHPRDSQVPSRT